MSKYTEEYSFAHDVDCFFQLKGVLFHFASNGNQIPNFIDEENNRRIQRLVYQCLVEDGNDIKENCIRYEDAVKQILRNEGYEEVLQKDVNNYLESFSGMANIGFISCDYIDGRFVPLAAPKNIGTDDSLFLQEVLKFAPEIASLGNYLDFSLIESITSRR